MKHRYCLGLVVCGLLLAVVLASAQDEDSKGLIQFVEQGLKEETLVEVIEAFVAEQDGTTVAEPVKVVSVVV